MLVLGLYLEVFMVVENKGMTLQGILALEQEGRECLHPGTVFYWRLKLLAKPRGLDGA